MKERPILFSPEMVRALLKGTKTQTRRALRAVPLAGPDDVEVVDPSGHVAYRRPPGHPDVQEALSRPGYTVRPYWSQLVTECPYGRPGDRLWVRERHTVREDPHDPTPGAVEVEYTDGETRRFMLGSDDHLALATRQRPYGSFPSIHMSRYACRVELEIVRVRVERLNDIDFEDAIREGVESPDVWVVDRSRFEGPVAAAVADFADLWERINGEDSWKKNPWVWVVEFKRVTP